MFVAVLATAAEIKETGFSEVLLKTVDVSSETEVEQWVKETVKKWNGIHVLVNNAAAFVFGTVETATLENWDKVLNVNVKVPVCEFR
jgi:NAD(P)-dependent dehydrogenase (short-subunit alcohol dehydrogenase family)